MKLISYLLLAVFSFVSIVSQELGHHCVHSQDDFHSNGWAVHEKDLKWAASVDDLPQPFRENLGGQYKDVFYFDLSDGTTDLYLIGKRYLPLRREASTYIYIKYYAHAPNVPDFFLYPAKGDDIHVLEGATDFKWREELIEIDNSGFIAIGASSGSVPGNFLFIDTLNFVQGKKLSKKEVKDLCPQKIPLPSKTDSFVSTSKDLPPVQQIEFLLRQNELLFQQIQLLNQQIELLNQQIGFS